MRFKRKLFVCELVSESGSPRLPVGSNQGLKWNRSSYQGLLPVTYGSSGGIAITYQSNQCPQEGWRSNIILQIGPRLQHEKQLGKSELRKGETDYPQIRQITDTATAQVLQEEAMNSGGMSELGTLDCPIFQSEEMTESIT